MPTKGPKKPDVVFFSAVWLIARYGKTSAHRRNKQRLKGGSRWIRKNWQKKNMKD